jgi:hypothetical protein
MNIPKEAIEKAIEGGWSNYRKEEVDRGGYKIALDPSFWQALGKGRWYTKSGAALHGKIFVNIHDEPCDEWEVKALEFLDLILTNGNTEKFWQELLTN